MIEWQCTVTDINVMSCATPSAFVALSQTFITMIETIDVKP